MGTEKATGALKYSGTTRPRGEADLHTNMQKRVVESRCGLICVRVLRVALLARCCEAQRNKVLALVNVLLGTCPYIAAS